MTDAPERPIPLSDDPTEALLQSLIGDCRRIIREVAVPRAQDTGDFYERCRYLNTAIELVRVSTVVGDAIARLRGGTGTELRQRITVERIQRQSTLQGGGG